MSGSNSWILRRSARTLMATVVVVVVTCGACGGSSDGSGNQARAKTDQTSPTPGGTSQSKDSKSLPDPCKLVSSDLVAELLGGPVAKPESSTHDNGTRTCLWELQKNVDAPDESTIGHTLSLDVEAPVTKGMTVEQDYENTYKYSPDKTKANVCEKSFWANNQLNALQDGVFLGALGGIGSDAPDAKAAVEKMMAAACKSV